MTWLLFVAAVLVGFVGGYLLGAVHAYQVATTAWQLTERAHGRGWPPMPRPFPPPSAPPPAPPRDC